MQTTPKAPRPGAAKRKPLIIILSAALIVIAALVTLLLVQNAANQQPFPVRGEMVPGAVLPTLDTPQAMRYDLSTAEQAQAYFERLLTSKYIGTRGDTPQAPQPAEGGWTVQELNSDGTALTAAFDNQGIITSLSVPVTGSGALKNANPPYRLGNGDESLFTFIRAFAYEYLPDVTIVSCLIESDQYNDEGRYITVLVDSQFTTGAYRFVVQIDPIQRIAGFEVLAEPSLAFVRTSRIAEADTAQAAGDAISGGLDPDSAAQLARDTLAATFSLPADEVAGYILVDVLYYTQDSVDGYTDLDSPAYWVVIFRMPQTEERMYSDYSVFLDDETGEVLKILDPSNISNG